jgi:hypothetical protein
MLIWVVDCLKSVLRDLVKENAVGFVLWLLPIEEINVTSLIFGFPKNERSNIDKNEEEALKKLAFELLSLSSEALEIAKKDNELIEVDCNAEEEISDS